MDQKKRVKVTINHKEYTVITNETVQHVHVVEDIVNEQLQQLLELMPQASTEDVAVLLALNTVSKQLQLSQEVLQLRKQLQDARENTLESGHYNQLFSKKSSRRSVHAHQTSFDEFTNVFEPLNRATQEKQEYRGETRV